MRAPILSGVARINLRAEMQQAYEVDGLTIEQVAEKFSRSYGTTHKLLSEAGTEIRPRGGFHGR